MTNRYLRSLEPPRRSWREALPPRLRRWWSGYPRLALEDSGALLLPSLLPLRPKDRLLVIGCGSGTLPTALGARIPLTTPPVGLDSDLGALNLAAAIPAIDVVRAVPDALPFRDAHFTALLAGHQIRTWDDAKLLRFLEESWRVLTHNGIVVLWEVAPSRSARVNGVWRHILADGDCAVRLRTFAEIGRLGREAGFAWIQTLRLRPFLWPPGPRVSVMMRKERYDEQTIHLGRGETPD